MFFKSLVFKSSRMVLTLAALALVFSCQLRVSQDEVAVKGKLSGFGGIQTGCLNGTGQLIVRYFEGQTEPEEVRSKWECGLTALDLFVNRTVGQTDGVYTPTELQRFLQRYFLTDIPLTDELVDEFMELKSALIGGSTKQLTRAELLHLKALIQTFQKQSLELLPEMPVTPKALGDADEARVERVISKIQGAAQALIRVLMERPGVAPGEVAPIHYSFEHLGYLLDEVARIYPGPTPRQLRERLPLLIALKRILISPDLIRLPSGALAEGLTGRQLMRVFDVAARGYGISLRLSRVLKGETPVETTRGRENAYRSLSDLLNLLKNAVAQYPRAEIPFREFHRLVAALDPSDLGKIRLSSVAGLVNPFLCHLVMAGGSCRNPDGTRFEAQLLGRQSLKLFGITRLQSFLTHWHEGQLYLETVHERLLDNVSLRRSPRVVEGFSLFRTFSPQDWVTAGRNPIARPTYELNQISAQAAAELRSMIVTHLPLFNVQDAKQILFLPYQTPREHSLYNLSRLNWQRIVLRMIIEGFGRDPRRATLGIGIDLDEAKELIETLTPLMADLKIIDERSVGVYLKRFREASLFTSLSDGDFLLEFDEGVAYLSELLSASPLAKRIYAVLEQPCGEAKGPPPADQAPPRDAYGRLWLDEKCVSEELFKNFEELTNFMPAMRNYYLQLVDKAEQEALQGAGPAGVEAPHQKALADFKYFLLEASRQNSVPQSWFNSYISEGTASVLQFVETLYSRFDINGDGVLTPDEGILAKPVFMPTLARLSPRKEKVVLNGLYTFLLRYGRAPQLNECGGLTGPGTSEFAKWMVNPDHSYAVDRTTMLSIFRDILILTAPKPASCESG